MLGLSALFDTRAEVIAAILFYSFKKSEKKTVAILSRHNLVLSLAGRAKLKEALPLPHHAKHCDDGKKPSKQVTKKGQAQPAQSTVLLKEGQPPGRFSLLPLECFMHILSFLPTKEILALLGTCRSLFSIAKDEFLWKQLYARHFGGPLTSHDLSLVEKQPHVARRAIVWDQAKQAKGLGSRRRVGSRLHWAASRGHLAYIQRTLHERKLWPSPGTQREMLRQSAEHGHAHVVRALIPITADADRAALEGHRAIHIAACNGHTDVVQALLDFDNEMVNAPNMFGTTPLHLAVYGEHYETARVLIKRGAHVGACDQKMVTPLHNAVAKGNKDLFWFLTSCGASCEVVDKDGTTLTEWAELFNQKEMVDLLASSLCP